MERNNTNLDLDYRQLLDRSLFGGEKLSDYISRVSFEKAEEKISEINEGVKITPLNVIKISETKLMTWNIGGNSLDHTQPLVA